MDKAEFNSFSPDQNKDDNFKVKNPVLLPEIDGIGKCDDQVHVTTRHSVCVTVGDDCSSQGNNFSQSGSTLASEEIRLHEAMEKYSKRSVSNNCSLGTANPEVPVGNIFLAQLSSFRDKTIDSTPISRTSKLFSSSLNVQSASSIWSNDSQSDEWNMISQESSSDSTRSESLADEYVSDEKSGSKVCLTPSALTMPSANKVCVRSQYCPTARQSEPVVLIEFPENFEIGMQLATPRNGEDELPEVQVSDNRVSTKSLDVQLVESSKKIDFNKQRVNETCALFLESQKSKENVSPSVENESHSATDMKTKKITRGINLSVKTLSLSQVSHANENAVEAVLESVTSSVDSSGSANEKKLIPMDKKDSQLLFNQELSPKQESTNYGLNDKTHGLIPERNKVHRNKFDMVTADLGRTEARDELSKNPMNIFDTTRDDITCKTMEQSLPTETFQSEGTLLNPNQNNTRTSTLERPQTKSTIKKKKIKSKNPLLRLKTFFSFWKTMMTLGNCTAHHN